VWPLIAENHGGPRFYAPDNIVATLRWIDERIGRTHDYTSLPEVGTTSTQVDDGVGLYADDPSDHQASSIASRQTPRRPAAVGH
jgi:hypothetical protein